MYVERVISGDARRRSGIIRSVSVNTNNLHAGAVVMDATAWTVWGGKTIAVNTRHSCGTRESQRCAAASELRAIYHFLVTCGGKGKQFDIRMTHPRALAQMQYWLSVERKDELTAPRLYTGRTLNTLAKIVFASRQLISVQAASEADAQFTAVGKKMTGVMIEALTKSPNDSLPFLQARVPRIATRHLR